MRVTKYWINSFFAENLTTEEISDALFAVGIEIDEVIETGQGLDQVVVAQIESFEKHPDADKLSVCKINDGTEVHDLICGAKNFVQGDKVALAKIGAKLPNGLKIKKSKIRGVESSGMLCSEEELGLKDSSEGILILSPEQELGTPVKKALGLDDVVFVLDVTPNRGDCFSVLGAAMEVAAARDISINTRSTYCATATDTNIEFKVADNQACPFYSLTKIDDVQVAESPLFLRMRLDNTGVRPINNVVDITNYVLIERGQPLHAFDADKVEGSITVRMAQTGEKIGCLDEVEYTLTENDLVIADASGPIAIAGIMGGARTAVTGQTKHVLLESAWFDPQIIRNTSKRLNIISESSKRFEREIDGSAVLANAMIAAAMLQTHAGGNMIGTQSLGKQASEPHVVVVKEAALQRCLGVEVKNAHEYLIRLGFEVEKIDDGWKVFVPLRRPEILREIDVIEEIARVFGYQNIPASLPPLESPPLVDSRFKQRNQLRQVLVQSGLFEVCTYSFGSQQEHDVFAQIGVGTPVEIENPIIASQTVMKTSMVANLIQAWKTNQSRQIAGAALFECGKVYFQDNDHPSEQERFAVLLSGKKADATWNADSSSYDYFDLKGVVEQLFDRLCLQVTYQAMEKGSCFHPGQSAAICIDGKTIGYMGVMHPGLLQVFGLDDDVIVAEVMIDPLLQSMQGKKTFQPFSIYPHVKRDLAFVVDENVTHQQFMVCIDGLGLPILDEVTIFDVYQGEGVQEGQKGLAYRFDFCSRSKTLKDKEVDKAIEKITKKLGDELLAKVR